MSLLKRYERIGFYPLDRQFLSAGETHIFYDLQKPHHRRRRPWSRRLPPSTKTTSNSTSEAIAPGGGPFSPRNVRRLLISAVLNT
jgi:hypothetical protein